MVNLRVAHHREAFRVAADSDVTSASAKMCHDVDEGLNLVNGDAHYLELPEIKLSDTEFLDPVCVSHISNFVFTLSLGSSLSTSGHLS